MASVKGQPSCRLLCCIPRPNLSGGLGRAGHREQHPASTQFPGYSQAQSWVIFSPEVSPPGDIIILLPPDTGYNVFILPCAGVPVPIPNAYFIKPTTLHLKVNKATRCSSSSRAWPAQLVIFNRFLFFSYFQLTEGLTTLLPFPRPRPLGNPGHAGEQEG